MNVYILVTKYNGTLLNNEAYTTREAADKAAYWAKCDGMEPPDVVVLKVVTGTL